MTHIGAISVVPQPDCQRRVYMLFEGSDLPRSRYALRSSPIDHLPLNRAGFVLIEWGGTQLNSRSSDLN